MKSTLSILIAATALLFGSAATLSEASPHPQDSDGEETKRYEREILEQSLQPVDDRDNAAKLYLKIFEAMIESGNENDTDWERFLAERERYPGPASYQSETAARLLKNNAEILRMAHAATSMEYTDFGLNTDEGMMSMLPHLSPMRELSRLMELEANNHRANGRETDSARALSSLLRLSTQTASDGVIINSLVGTAAMDSAFDSLEEAIARGEFDAEGAAIVLKGFDVDRHDPYRFGAATAKEFEQLELTLTMMEDPGTEFSEMFGWTGDESDPSAASELETMSREELLADLQASEPGFELAAQAMNEDDPERARAMIAELARDIEDGRYGRLAPLVMPVYDKILENKIRAGERYLKYDGILRAIASGADPAEFGNAALLYREAFPELGRIGESEQELVDMIRDIVTVTGSCDAIPDQMMKDLHANLETTAGIIEIFRKAARLHRCEWDAADIARHSGRIIPHGDWVRPMRAGIRLTLANAAMLACLAEEHEGEVDLKRSIVSLIADAMSTAIHLGDGSHLMSSAASAAAMAEVVDFATRMLPKLDLEGDSGDLLETRFARLDDGDPLGWRSARTSMLRPEFHRILMRHGLKDPTHAANLARNWNTERLAAIAFYRSMKNPGTGGLPDLVPDERGDLFDIGDVLVLDERKLEILASPHRRLIELIEMVDTTEPVPTMKLKALGESSMERMSELIDSLQQIPGTTD